MIFYYILIPIILGTIVNINADFSTVEIDEQNNDASLLVLTALFSKINSIIMEIEKINKRLSNQEIQENLNMGLIKDEISSLKDQNIKMDIILMEMKEEVLKKIVIQENLIQNSNKDIENINQTIKQNRNWSVILRRQDGSENFERKWSEYKNGFGNSNGEFFIGLEKLHTMTTYDGPQELLIILKDFDNQTRYAKYDDFVVGSETEKYEIKNLGKYNGDATDALTPHLNQKFSTIDHNNDNRHKTISCAMAYKGGWWFDSCEYCLLTGPYAHQSKLELNGFNVYSGILWNTWLGNDNSLKLAEMMIRPKF